MSKYVVFATWDDVPHLTEKQKAELWEATPEHERDARGKGIPVLGSGRVFPLSEESIRVEPMEIPAHWPQIGGMDFGWDHPFAGVRMAWDRDPDTVYVVNCYRERKQTPVIHAASLKPWGAWLPWAWPHDGLQHDKGSGEQLKEQYVAQGLNMLPDRATFADGTHGLEAGVIEMLDRMKTARWKVFSTCGEWFDEFRLYRREEGKIVKLGDDLLSASRYGMMMLRFAVTKPTTTPIKYKKLGTI